MVSLLLTQSGLMRPRGAYGTPDVEEYSRILRGMIMPAAEGGESHTVVRNDPVTGMPASMYNLVPALDESGSIVMIEEGLEEKMDEPGLVPDLTLDAWPEMAPQPLVDTEAARWADDCGIIGYPSPAALPDDMRVWIQPDDKRDNSSSALRYAAYQGAATVGEIRARNDKSFAAKDLSWDLRRGFILLIPTAAQTLPQPLFHGPVMEGVGISWAVAESADVDQFRAQVIDRMHAQDDVIAMTVAQTNEMRRIEVLEELPSGVPSPELLAGFPRGTRQTQAYRDGALQLRVQYRRTRRSTMLEGGKIMRSFHPLATRTISNQLWRWWQGTGFHRGRTHVSYPQCQWRLRVGYPTMRPLSDGKRR